MLGLAMIAPRTRSRFLIAATIAAAACLGGITVDCAAAQTESDYASLLTAADRDSCMTCCLMPFVHNFPPDFPSARWACSEIQTARGLPPPLLCRGRGLNVLRAGSG